MKKPRFLCPRGFFAQSFTTKLIKRSGTKTTRISSAFRSSVFILMAAMSTVLFAKPSLKNYCSGWNKGRIITICISLRQILFKMIQQMNNLAASCEVSQLMRSIGFVASYGELTPVEIRYWISDIFGARAGG